VAASGQRASSCSTQADAAASPHVYTWPAKYPDKVELLGVDQSKSVAYLRLSRERRGPERIVSVELKTKQATIVMESKVLPTVTQVETMTDDSKVKQGALDGGLLQGLATSECKTSFVRTSACCRGLARRGMAIGWRRPRTARRSSSTPEIGCIDHSMAAAP